MTQIIHAVIVIVGLLAFAGLVIAGHATDAALALTASIAYAGGAAVQTAATSGASNTPDNNSPPKPGTGG
jgi:hypothetical protein